MKVRALEDVKIKYWSKVHHRGWCTRVHPKGEEFWIADIEYEAHKHELEIIKDELLVC